MRHLEDILPSVQKKERLLSMNQALEKEKSVGLDMLDLPGISLSANQATCWPQLEQIKMPSFIR